MSGFKRLLSLFMLCVIFLALAGMVLGFVRMRYVWVGLGEIVLLLALSLSYWLNSHAWSAEAMASDQQLSARETRISPHWVKLIISIGFCFFLGIGMIFLAHYLWWDEEYVIAIAVAVIAVMAIYAASNWLSWFAVLMRSGYMIRMNKNGFQYAGWAMIPWSKIHEAKTRTETVNDKTHTFFSITFKPLDFEAALPPFWIRWSNWVLLHYKSTTRELRIPITFVKKHTASLDHSAKRWMSKARA